MTWLPNPRTFAGSVAYRDDEDPALMLSARVNGAMGSVPMGGDPDRVPNELPPAPAVADPSSAGSAFTAPTVAPPAPVDRGEDPTNVGSAVTRHACSLPSEQHPVTAEHLAAARRKEQR